MLKFNYGDAIAYVYQDGSIAFAVITEIIRTINARGVREVLVVQPQNGVNDSVDPEDAEKLEDVIRTAYGDSKYLLDRSPAIKWCLEEQHRRRFPEQMPALNVPDIAQDTNV